VLASSVQALEIASQLTVSGWHNKLFSILLGRGQEKYKEFWSFSCDNNQVFKVWLGWVLGIQTSLSLILFQYEECDIERMKLSRVFFVSNKAIRKVRRLGGENDQFWHIRASNA
jgi:hypothetical protein